MARLSRGLNMISVNHVCTAGRHGSLNTFSEHLCGLRGCRVRLDRGGPNMVAGTLVGVYADYLTLKTDHGKLLHIPTYHLKSVTRDPAQCTADGYARSCDDVCPQPKQFCQLVATLRGTLVQVNEGGPERVMGLVYDVAANHLQLITNLREMVSVPLGHVRSIRAADIQTQEACNEEQQGQKKEESDGERPRVRVVTGRER